MTNGRFTRRLDGYTLQGGGQVEWQQLSWQDREWDTPVLRHPAAFTGKSVLCYTIPARDAHGHATLIPGEDYLLSLALRAKNLGKNAFYDVTMQADDQPATTLVLSRMKPPVLR